MSDNAATTGTGQSAPSPRSAPESTSPTAAIVVADRTGTIIGFDTAAERFFGYSADEALGASLDLIVPADLREAHWNGFYTAVEFGHANSEGTAMHLPVSCHDGQTRVFPGVFRLVRDPHGNGIGAVATFAPAVDAAPFTPVTDS